MIRTRLASLNAFEVFAAVIVVLMSLLIVYPLGRMLSNAFLVDGSLSLVAFSHMWDDASLRSAVKGTAMLVGISVPIAVSIAAFFAWCNERTNARLGWLSDVLPLVPLLMPSLASIIGLVFLFAPRAGYGNIFLRFVFDKIGFDVVEGPINIFSTYGLISLYVLFLVPFAYLPLAAALRNLDPGYEEASRVAGAGVMKTVRTVTLPAVLPAIASSMLLSIVVAFALFTAPVIVGTTARINTVSVWVYHALTQFPPRKDEAIAVGLVLLVVILTFAMVERRIRKRGNFATIGGRARSDSPIDLGKLRWVVRGLMLLYVALTAALPFGALCYLSLQKFWTLKPKFEGNFNNFNAAFFDNPTAKAGLQHSFLLGALGATIAVFVIAVMARYMQRAGHVGGALVDFATKAPATMSHLIIALAFLVALGGAPFNLQGTLTILVLVYVVLYLPFGSVITNAAYAQIGNDLVDSSRVCGASPLRTFRKVELPLLAPGLVATWCLCFVLMAGELTASAILTTGGLPVLGTAILSFYNNGNFTLVAALGTIMTIASIVVVGFAQFVSRRFLSLAPPT